MNELYELVVSKQAKQDIKDIWYYIAADNRIAANKILDDFSEQFQYLITMPKMGMIRDDLHPHLRSIVFKKHLIFYKVDNENIFIVRVVRGSRFLPDLL